MNKSIQIDPIRIGALPILQCFEKKLGIVDILENDITHDQRDKIPVSQTLITLFYNIALERFPLYKVGQWATERNLIKKDLESSLNDDRVGRALDRLYRADRTAILTRVVLQAIKVFSINTDRVHNDSTSVTLTGDYGNYKNTKAAKPKRGFNKDHRPDLKQLLFSLSASGDGTIPLYFKVWDGNITDDKTHIRNWMSLRGLLCRVDFIYVADSKLCTRENLDFINGEGGFFITILPQTRLEDKQFKDWIQTNPPQWQEVLRLRGLQRYAPHSIYWVFESPLPSIEGYRIIWIKSSQKEKLDVDRRTTLIEKTVQDLTDLSQRREFKNRDKLQALIEEILKTHKTQNFFYYQIQEHTTQTFRQHNKGRPSDGTLYKKTEKLGYHFTWSHNQEAIRYNAKCDGIFPLITNRKDQAKEILKIYKFQPRLEKRHQQLKTVYQVAPVFIKNPERIEALLFLYFLSLMVTSLIERQVRKAMVEKDLTSIPIYPEKRECKRPTADKVLDLFREVRLHCVTAGATQQVVADKLTDIQQITLGLLGIGESQFFKL